MNNNNDLFSSIKKFVGELMGKYPTLSPDNAFILWFLQAFILDDDKDIVKAIKGVSRDKGIDAIFIDDKARVV
ncbi:MAG: hypothetical protein Q8919_11015, partial [Bacteroidota bacterium]|nr:hypothetical protein [Bacteroidota bacterium]